LDVRQQTKSPFCGQDSYEVVVVYNLPERTEETFPFPTHGESNKLFKLVSDYLINRPNQREMVLPHEMSARPSLSPEPQKMQLGGADQPKNYVKTNTSVFSADGLLFARTTEHETCCDHYTRLTVGYTNGIKDISDYRDNQQKASGFVLRLGHRLDPVAER
jgi:hypothetical protein